MALAADQDSVRLLAVESCGAFAQALGREDAINSLLPIVQKFAQVGVGASFPAPVAPCMPALQRASMLALAMIMGTAARQAGSSDAVKSLSGRVQMNKPPAGRR